MNKDTVLLQIRRLQFFFLVVLFVLTSCSAIPEWLGEGEGKSDIEGTRISVLDLETQIDSDEDMKDFSITVPDAEENILWEKSQGYSGKGVSNPLAPQEFTTRKTVNFGKGVTGNQHFSSSPVIAEGKVYVIDTKGVLTAYEAMDIDNKVWRQKILVQDGKTPFAGAGITYSGGSLYITTGQRSVISIDASTGEVLWQRSINSIARSAPEIYRDVLLVNTVDNKLYALDADDGGIMWSHEGINEEISVFGVASPAANDGIAIIPYSSGELYALRIIDGSQSWSDSFTAKIDESDYEFIDIDASPIVHNGSVYAISNDGILAAIDLYSGIRSWERELSGNKTPWIAEDYLYLINNNSQITAIHAPTGGIKWVKQLPAFEDVEKKRNPILWNGPVMAGDMLLVVSSNGQLLSLSPQTGEMVHKHKVPEGIHTSPAVAYNQIFLITDEADLIALGDKNAPSKKESDAPSSLNETDDPVEGNNIRVSPMLRSMIDKVKGIKKSDDENKDTEKSE